MGEKVYFFENFVYVLNKWSLDSRLCERTSSIRNLCSSTLMWYILVAWLETSKSLKCTICIVVRFYRRFTTCAKFATRNSYTLSPFKLKNAFGRKVRLAYIFIIKKFHFLLLAVTFKVSVGFYYLLFEKSNFSVSTSPQTFLMTIFVLCVVLDCYMDY